MSKKANPVLIGSFVIGAIGLAIAAILILGNLQLNRERYRCVLFFNGSLHGLDVGAPVTYRGVKIGKVGAIEILFDRREKSYHIPVYVDIEGNGARLADNYREAGFDNPEEFFESMVRKGLQARLKMSSLITGKLYIEFTFDPTAATRTINRQGKYLQIPTASTGLQQLTQTLETLPVKTLVEKSIKVLDGLERFVNTPELQGSVKTFNQTLVHFNGLVTQAREQLSAMDPKVNSLLDDLARLTNRADTVLAGTDRELRPAIGDMRKTLADISIAADRLTTSLEALDSAAGENRELPYQLGRTLEEVRQAARSIGGLADYLRRHPSALLTGAEEESR